MASYPFLFTLETCLEVKKATFVKINKNRVFFYIV
jgi:hypothetical protein